MKRKLTYTTFGTTMILVCFLLTVEFYAQASDVMHIAFTSERDGNAEIYIMDTRGKISRT